MSFGGAVRRLGFRVRDAVKFARADRVCTQWKEIEETLADAASGRVRVEASLRECLDFAASQSPFFRPYAGRPLSAFPVLNKLDFLAHYDEIRTDAFRTASVWTMSTSGSTGTPFRVVQNLAKRNRVLAELKYFGALAGYESHEEMFFFRARPKARRAAMFWSNVRQKDILTLGEDDCERIFAEQSDPALRGVLAYASTYDVLTEYWLRRGYSGNPNVRAVISMSSYLTEGARTRAAQFWPNAKVVSRYSNQENGLLAQETGKADLFRPNWASYWFEVLKFDSDEPAAEGEQGRIVITDMFNRAFPMIRYDNGDVGSLVRGPDGWLWLADIAGRRIDLIFSTTGETVSPHAISRTLDGALGIRQWQFLQNGACAYAVKYVPGDEGFTACAEDRRAREDGLRELLGRGAEITWERVGEIPVLASNKRKVTVQNWRK